MCLNAFATWQGLNIAVKSNRANQICDNIKPCARIRNVGYLSGEKAHKMKNFLARSYLNQKVYTSTLRFHIHQLKVGLYLSGILNVKWRPQINSR